MRSAAALSPELVFAWLNVCDAFAADGGEVSATRSAHAATKLAMWTRHMAPAIEAGGH